MSHKSQHSHSIPSETTANVFLRVGLALAVLVSILAFAVRAQAQANTPTMSVRPTVGALVAVGSTTASSRGV